MHQPRSVVREGLVTGLIGAGAVAVWFLGLAGAAADDTEGASEDRRAE